MPGFPKPTKPRGLFVHNDAINRIQLDFVGTPSAIPPSDLAALAQQCADDDIDIIVSCAPEATMGIEPICYIQERRNKRVAVSSRRGETNNTMTSRGHTTCEFQTNFIKYLTCECLFLKLKREDGKIRKNTKRERR